jgi:hypothetical protein
VPSGLVGWCGRRGRSGSKGVIGSLCIKAISSVGGT